MADLNRRGFLASLREVFSSRSDGDLFFLGVQAVINVYGEAELRRDIHRILAEAPETERPLEKSVYYKRIAAVLREHVPSIEYGYWDYLTDADEAAGEFDDWLREINATSATVEEELGEEIDEGFRLSAEKDYVVVTLLFLLEHGREHETLARMLDTIPEERQFTPWAFARLVDALNYIDFERAQADATFIHPGSDEDGFSWTDMRAPGWEYLRPVIGTVD